MYISGDHRDLPVLTHAFPTRRSADLLAQIYTNAAAGGGDSGGQVGPGLSSGTLGSADNAGATSMGSTAGSFGSRSEEHTSELQSLMRTSYAVFCLQKKTHSYHSLDNIAENRSKIE